MYQTRIFHQRRFLIDHQVGQEWTSYAIGSLECHECEQLFLFDLGFFLYSSLFVRSGGAFLQEKEKKESNGDDFLFVLLLENLRRRRRKGRRRRQIDRREERLDHDETTVDVWGKKESHYVNVKRLIAIVTKNVRKRQIAHAHAFTYVSRLLRLLFLRLLLLVSHHHYYYYALTSFSSSCAARIIRVAFRLTPIETNNRTVGVSGALPVGLISSD